MKQASAEELKRIVCTLCDDIGVRLAGSPQERKAADFLAAEMKKYTPHVSVEGRATSSSSTRRQATSGPTSLI